METEENDWEPTYTDFDEGIVSLRKDEPQSVMRMRNEVTIVLQNDGTETYRGNGAVFWVDEKHLYLRFDWGVWFPLSGESPEICGDITRRKAITLNVYTGTDCKSYPLRIYRIDALPEDLFSAPDAAPPDAEASDELDVPPEPSPGRPTLPPEIILAHQTAQIVLAEDGTIIETCLRDAPRYDVVFAHGRHYVVSYFAGDGVWASDDLDDSDGWPLWYSSDGIRRSPLAVARALDAHFRAMLPKGTPLSTLLMLSADCILLGEKEFVDVANACGIVPVRLRPAPQSCMKGLKDVFRAADLRREPRCEEPVPYVHVARAVERFDPEKCPPPVPQEQ